MNEYTNEWMHERMNKWDLYVNEGNMINGWYGAQEINSVIKVHGMEQLEWIFRFME